MQKTSTPKNLMEGSLRLIYWKLNVFNWLAVYCAFAVRRGGAAGGGRRGAAYWASPGAWHAGQLEIVYTQGPDDPSS